MPTAATEIAAAKRTASVFRYFLGRRRLLRNQRRDLEALYAEVVGNLEVVRAAFVAGPFRRQRADDLSTVAWRRVAYPLTNLVDGPVIEPALAAELDALAAEFERAQRQTLLSSDWEHRLLAVATALQAMLSDHPRRRWDRIFLRRRGPADLPALDTRVATPSSPAEMQRRFLARHARDG